MLGNGPGPRAIYKILTLYLDISYDVTKVHNPIIKYRGYEERGLIDFIAKKLCLLEKLYYSNSVKFNQRPSGAMDSASDFGSEDSRFKSSYDIYYFF